jgi:hypothetical protein
VRLATVPSRSAVGHVLVGAIVTAVAGVLVLLALPTIGVVASIIVGPTFPVLVFVATLVHCPIVGGVTAASLEDTPRDRCVVIGTLAGALGTLVIGLLVGAGLAIVMLGFIPADGQAVDVTAVTLTMGGLGGLIGVVLGGGLGGLGGSLVAIGR